MSQVEIYTKAFCGYCARAKALLESKGVPYEEYDRLKASLTGVAGPRRG